MGFIADVESFFGLTPAAPARRRATRSTAPVPSAQHVGMLVAPSIPGHVIPVPAPVDLKALDTSTGLSGTGLDAGLLGKVSAALQKSSGQGAPYVDPEGYWRDFTTGALYQFHDPNTNAPIGRPGYMPNRYVQTYQMQQAMANADPAATAAGTDPAAIAQTVAQGVSTAATVVGAVAAGSDAAGTAAAVAGVAGSVLACLGPLPLEHASRWRKAEIETVAVLSGDRALVLVLAPSLAGIAVTAIEVAATSVARLGGSAADLALGVAAAYADHGHAFLGAFGAPDVARGKAERYGARWKARREAKAACACQEIRA